MIPAEDDPGLFHPVTKEQFREILSGNVEGIVVNQGHRWNRRQVVTGRRVRIRLGVAGDELVAIIGRVWVAKSVVKLPDEAWEKMGMRADRAKRLDGKLDVWAPAIAFSLEWGEA